MAMTASDNTSPLYRRWAGVFTLAAALQQRCWFVSLNKIIYPNLYLLLVGPSAAGKGVALDPAAELLSSLDNHFVAPASVTSAGFADELEEALVTFIGNDGSAHQFHALTVLSREFGVFLPVYDSTLLNTLTDLYDNKGYDERRRGRGKRLKIDKAVVNMVGGTTPTWLSNVLPETAWGDGFMSRVIVVYANALPPIEIQEEIDTQLSTSRVGKKLASLAQRTGRIRWCPDGLRFFNQWNTTGRAPAPTHPKLFTYNERRHFNAMKLAFIHAVAAEHATIEKSDVVAALDLLFETEEAMPEAFKAMKTGGDQTAIKELWHFMYQRYLKHQKPIQRHYLVTFLQDRVPVYNVEKIIATMEASRLIKASAGGTYIPVKPDVD